MNTSFERTIGKDEWLTPPKIIQMLGEFDLDPCSPINRPWDTAKKHYSLNENGLVMPWNGRVWLNPPYGNQTKIWLEKMSKHRNGIALIFARTDTKMFQNLIFKKAHSILFIAGRINFYDVKGNKSKNGAGAPSVLVSYSKEDSIKLKSSGIGGYFVYLNGDE